MSPVTKTWPTSDADEGDGLRMLRIPAGIEKQPKISGPPVGAFLWGQKTLHRNRNHHVTKFYTATETLADSLERRPSQEKVDVRFGISCVRI